MIRLVWNRLQNTHRFFLSQLLYPLALSSALAVSLFAARAFYSHRLTFVFLVWNLFLAWVPYLFSLWIAAQYQRDPRRGWTLLIPSFIWLIFLPNAPYLVTDLLHLDERLPVPLWFDIGMLATFAWSGCFLAIASIRAMEEIVRDFFGRWVAWLFVFSTMGLSGLGIYLGRFLNWNSWDLILRPQTVLASTISNFAHPIRNPQPFGVAGVFAAFLLVAYLTFASTRRQPMQEKE